MSRNIIDRSLQRLAVKQLDLVQFHWWDYNTPRYVETALELDRLRRAGKIAQIGLTNFDTQRLGEIVSAGVPIVSHQVQYSLLDERPATAMVDYCRSHEVVLLCFGTVAGGFLSERWLDKSEPNRAGSRADLSNRSLIKYKLIIEDFGGWDLFQELLGVLARIAAKYRTDIASVASRAILIDPRSAGAIVGATNASAPAIQCTHRSPLRLDADDATAIAAVIGHRSGPNGDVYALERDRTGRHGQIMKYELNALPTDNADTN